MNTELIPEHWVHMHDDQPVMDLNFPHEKFITLWVDGKETDWLMGPLSTCLPLYKSVRKPRVGNWNKVEVSDGEYAGYAGLYRILDKEDLH